jgi:hypothetical protein
MARDTPRKTAEEIAAEQLAERQAARQARIAELLEQADRRRADTGGSLTGYTKALAWAFDQLRLELGRQLRDEPERGVLNTVQVARDLLATAGWVPGQDPTAAAAVRRRKP